MCAIWITKVLQMITKNEIGQSAIIDQINELGKGIMLWSV